MQPREPSSINYPRLERFRLVARKFPRQSLTLFKNEKLFFLQGPHGRKHPHERELDHEPQFTLVPAETLVPA